MCCTFDYDDNWDLTAPLDGGVVDAVRFAREELRFEPDGWQKEVLRSGEKRGILNCCRQGGKSTVAAIKAIHRGWVKPESLVLVASPTERQSAEFVRKARWVLGRMGIRARGDGDNKISLLLPNGSRIVGLPGREGRCGDSRRCR